MTVDGEQNPSRVGTSMNILIDSSICTLDTLFLLGSLNSVEM